MFLQINEHSLLDFRFEKVQLKSYYGNYKVFYYKQGYYLKPLWDGYYALYNGDLNLLGTINNFYKVQVLLLLQRYPISYN
jgi:hypothetical protein